MEQIKFKELLEITQHPTKYYKIIKEEKFKNLPENYLKEITNFIGETCFDLTKFMKQYFNQDIDSWYTCDCKIRKQIVINAFFSKDNTKALIILLCYNCSTITVLYLKQKPQKI